MKIIKPSTEYLGIVPTDYAGALRFIELAGRTCYRSEDKITDTSAEGFVHRLIKAGHLAMVEHSNFVVWMPQQGDLVFATIYAMAGKFLSVTIRDGWFYVGGNLTAWYQRGNIFGWEDELFRPFFRVYGDLFGIVQLGPVDTPWTVCPHNEIPLGLHRHAVRFVCDRGVTHELVRHRPCSFAQESTRYVRYDGITVIEPHDWDTWAAEERDAFEVSCMIAEKSYQLLIDAGRKPQQARAVLPTALRTEIVVTADPAEWRHIQKLRTAPTAQPDMRRVMNDVPWGAIV